VSLLPISVTIISKNEELRIREAILSVKNFASEVIVVDSGSTDRTVQMAIDLGAKVSTHPFQGFGQQKNLAHAQATQEWVLNLDADERVTPELEAEIRLEFSKPSLSEICGFQLPRKTWYLDRWVMHGGWYPNYLPRLSRQNKSRWSEPHLHEALLIEGKTVFLDSPLEHHSFPSQKSHVLKNVEYAEHACAALAAKGKRANFASLLLKPAWKFIHGYLIQRGFLDGNVGLLIAFHSSYATFLRYAYLLEQQRRSKL
jgi:glycosyltransferase involved in cell wall biosynthesis